MKKREMDSAPGCAITRKDELSPDTEEGRHAIEKNKVLREEYEKSMRTKSLERRKLGSAAVGSKYATPPYLVKKK